MAGQAADAPSQEIVDSSGSTAFFYGTLMAPEVFFNVCYRTSRPPASLAAEHVFRPAVLVGYCRRRVRLAEYPGIVADETAGTTGSSVRGVLVSGLTTANLHHLDVFEGSEYERRTVTVMAYASEAAAAAAAAAAGEPVRAQVYVFKDAAALEPREWDYEEFRRDEMASWTRGDYTFEEKPATVVS